MSGSYDGYASHQPMLIRAAMAATRYGLPILEMGCGDYSTPLLQGFAKEAGIPLITASSDPDWLDRYVDGQGKDVFCHPVKEDGWEALLESDRWGMVFIDNELVVAKRLPLLIKAADHAHIAVMHDAEIVEQRGLTWDETREAWKYVAVNEWGGHWTVVCSQVIDVGRWV